MLKGKNKEGWIRIVEAFFAILVIAVVVLIVVQQDQDKRGDVSSRIHDSITSIIRDIQLDNNARGEIIGIQSSGLAVEWEEFNESAPQTQNLILEKTPDYLNCVGKICATNDSCLLTQNPTQTIYAESVIISSDLETYNPRTLKVFCWEKGEEGTGSIENCGDGFTGIGETCDDGNTVSGDGCSATCQTEVGAVCGNGIQESGEECDDGNNVSGDGCSSTCQAESVTFLNGCGEITSPGSYMITSNLVGTAPNPCINIHDTTNVYLDCQNHNITVPGLITGQTIIKVNKVDDFSLQNCVLPVTSVPSGHIPQSLWVTNSSQGLISNNTFSGGSLFNAGYNTYIQVINNIFNRSAFQQALSNNTKIEANWFDWNYSGVAFILSNDGFGNSVKNNFMNGHNAGNGSAHTGFSTGIVIDGQNGIVISGNTMYNFWDCGIITLGLTQNSAFSNNTIKNATFCGIGGWYWNSMKNNSFAQNQMDNAGTMFTFYRRYALKPSESFVYFTDNIFTDNILTHFNVSLRGYSTDIVMDRNDWGEVTPDKFIASNATFTNNDFSNGTGPYISPRSAIIDGGGNKCGAPSLGQNSSPLVCN